MAASDKCLSGMGECFLKIYTKFVLNSKPLYFIWKGSISY